MEVNDDRYRELQAELDRVRVEIDDTNELIIFALAKRARQVRRIGQIKEEMGADVVQPGRKETMMRKVMDSATRRGLDEDLVTAVFDPIVAYAEAQQQALRRVEAPSPPQP